jgi:hypothetical protein
MSAGLRYSFSMESKTRMRYAAMIVGFLFATLVVAGAADPSSREMTLWTQK